MPVVRFGEGSRGIARGGGSRRIPAGDAARRHLDRMTTREPGPSPGRGAVARAREVGCSGGGLPEREGLRRRARGSCPSSTAPWSRRGRARDSRFDAPRKRYGRLTSRDESSGSSFPSGARPRLIRTRFPTLLVIGRGCREFRHASARPRSSIHTGHDLGGRTAPRTEARTPARTPRRRPSTRLVKTPSAALVLLRPSIHNMSFAVSTAARAGIRASVVQPRARRASGARGPPPWCALGSRTPHASSPVATDGGLVPSPRTRARPVSRVPAGCRYPKDARDRRSSRLSSQPRRLPIDPIEPHARSV